jgi:hypothetical protein
MHIDVSAGRLAAVATSKADGLERWTELRVYHMPLARRSWVAEALGCSVVPGEKTRTSRLASASLDRACRLFTDSDLGIAVTEMAREYAEENCARVTAPGTSATNDRDALALLFGVSADEVSASAAARAFEMGESSIRMALRDGRDIRVPLRTLLPFIDRAAFRRARGGEDRS